MASQNNIASEESSSSPQPARDVATQAKVKADPEKSPSPSNSQDDAAQETSEADPNSFSTPSDAQDEASQLEVKYDPNSSSSPSNSQDDASPLRVKAEPEKPSTTSPTAIDLLKSIDSKIVPPSLPLKELALLQKIHKQLQSESTKTQFLWNSFLQVFGLIFVVIFGVFSIIAFKIGEQANIQSSQANQLALLSFCFTSNSSTVEGLCSDVFQRATQTLPTLVTLVMGPAPSSTTSPFGSQLPDELSRAIPLCMILFLVLCLLPFVLKSMWNEKFAKT